MNRVIPEATGLGAAKLTIRQQQHRLRTAERLARAKQFPGGRIDNGCPDKLGLVCQFEEGDEWLKISLRKGTSEWENCWILPERDLVGFAEFITAAMKRFNDAVERINQRTDAGPPMARLRLAKKLKRPTLKAPAV